MNSNHFHQHTVSDAVSVPKNEVQKSSNTTAAVNHLEPTLPEKILYVALQTVALVAALFFGVWSVLSYKAAQKANDLGTIANQLSLLALCFSGGGEAGSFLLLNCLEKTTD